MRNRPTLTATDVQKMAVQSHEDEQRSPTPAPPL
jgi:hypothetical protein